MTRRIVVFGGSFDPVHDGHVAMADAACAARDPDEFLWIPAGHAPHKPERPPAPAEDRVAFLQLVLADRPGDRLCAAELERAGPSYAVDTLDEIAEKRPGAALEFLAGADSLAHLAAWRDVAGLFRRARFLFAPRAGWGEAELERFREDLDPALRDRFRGEMIAMEEVDVSSTALRAELARGRVPAGMPRAVAEEALRRGSYADADQ